MVPGKGQKTVCKRGPEFENLYFPSDYILTPPNFETFVVSLRSLEWRFSKAPAQFFYLVLDLLNKQHWWSEWSLIDCLIKLKGTHTHTHLVLKDTYYRLFTLLHSYHSIPKARFIAYFEIGKYALIFCFGFILQVPTTVSECNGDSTKFVEWMDEFRAGKNIRDNIVLF